MAITYNTTVYDVLSSTFRCMCRYDSNTLLLANTSGIYKYYLAIKQIEKIYSVSFTPQAIGYKDGYIYIYIGSVGFSDNKLVRYDETDFSSTELILNNYYSSSRPEGVYYGDIKFIDNFLYISYTNRNYLYNSGYTPLSYYDLEWFVKKVDLSTFTTVETVLSGRDSRGGSVRPLPSIYNLDTSEFFWYSYLEYNGSGNAWVQISESSLCGFTNNLVFRTYNNEIGTYNGFYYDNDIYIVTETSIVKYDTISNIVTKISNNTTNLIPSHYEIYDNRIYCLCGNNIMLISLDEYNITYNFSDGENIVAQLTNSLPIKQINFGSIDNTISLEIIFIDDSNTFVNYNVLNIPNNIVYGLSILKGKKADIISGVNDIVLYNDTTFYPVYRTYKPPTRTFQLNLYKNSAEPNRVDKTNYLTQIGTLYGAFRYETSITNMAITIQQEEFPKFNYVYIPIFNRYYYVTDITSIRQNLWEISLSIDVLMSYKDAIKSCNCFCDRNEFLYNDNIIDKKRVIEQGYDVESIAIQNDLFVDGNGSLVIQGFDLNLWS